MALSSSLIQSLSQYARSETVLVATDFDGVLAPLVDDPSTSAPLQGAVDALRRLQSGGDSVALVSGRHLDDLERVSGIAIEGPITLIGSHGAQSSRPLDLDTTMDEAAHSRLAAATAALERIAAQHPDVRVEHKPSGVVLHTRGVVAESADRAATGALAVPGQIADVHAMRGKDVIELSVLSVTKGLALQALSRSVGADAVLYLGDDVTDETVFTVLSGDEGHVTVKVGHSETAADHRVDSPQDVIEVLSRVADLREARTP